jgi:hypothetical protein
MSSEFVIEELGGFRRRVALSGYALPHWDKAEYPEMLNTKKTVYAGNPDATIQVLGYTIDDSHFQGMWLTRHLIGFVQATYQGAGEYRIETAQDLVNLIRRIHRSGQQLRVQWEDVVRIGVMKEFVPDYKRIEDVRWSMSFEWQKDGDVPDMPRAGGASIGTQGTQTALNAMQDRAAQAPASVDASYFDRFRAGLSTMRTGGLQYMRQIKEATQTLETPITYINSAISISQELGDEALSTVSGLIDVPITALKTSNRLIDTLKCERWRRNAAFEVDRFNGEVGEQTRLLRKKKVNPPLDTIVIQQDTTLRALSTRYYGTPDEWQRIANANGLVGSVVRAGTRVVIPASGGR